ncbi:hypothetical protein ABPG74_019306 [Tetrahymena malaccensis]
MNLGFSMEPSPIPPPITLFTSIALLPLRFSYSTNLSLSILDTFHQNQKEAFNSINGDDYDLRWLMTKFNLNQDLMKKVYNFCNPHSPSDIPYQLTLSPDCNQYAYKTPSYVVTGIYNLLNQYQCVYNSPLYTLNNQQFTISSDNFQGGNPFQCGSYILFTQVFDNSLIITFTPEQTNQIPVVYGLTCAAVYIQYCPDNCIKCNDDSSSCTLCVKGYYNNQGTCNQCNSLCQECTDATTNCLCKLQDALTQQCVQSCNSQQIQIINSQNLRQCIYVCDSTCQTCNGNQPNNCLTCKKDFYFFQNTCLVNCPNGYKKNLLQGSCDLCTDLTQPECFYCNIQCMQCNQMNKCTSCYDYSKLIQPDASSSTIMENNFVQFQQNALKFIGQSNPIRQQEFSDQQSIQLSSLEKRKQQSKKIFENGLKITQINNKIDNQKNQFNNQLDLIEFNCYDEQNQQLSNNQRTDAKLPSIQNTTSEKDLLNFPFFLWNLVYL